MDVVGRVPIRQPQQVATKDAEEGCGDRFQPGMMGLRTGCANGFRHVDNPLLGERHADIVPFAKQSPVAIY